MRISKWVKITIKDTPDFNKMIGSQVQRPFLPSSTSERRGQTLLGVPRGIYQGIQKVLTNFHNKMTEKKNLPWNKKTPIW